MTATQSTDLKQRLFSCIVMSQDGCPAKPLHLEMEDGRLVNVTDNLNRLLADAMNNALQEGDLDTLVQDLRYASDQLASAVRAINNEFIAE